MTLGQGEERLQDYGTYLIVHEKGLVFIIIPVLKSSSWTLDSLCQDHLYGLLPFLPFLYEKKLARKRRLPKKDVQELVQLARDVVKKLNELVESKTISEEFYQGLRGYCITVASQLMKNHMDQLEEVFTVMGNWETYQCPAEVKRRAREEGKAEGKAEGEAKGEIKGMAKLVLKGLVSKENVLASLDKDSVGLFKKYLRNPDLVYRKNA